MIELKREPLRPFARPVRKPFCGVWRNEGASFLGEGIRRKMTAGTIVFLRVVLVPVAILKARSVAERHALKGSDRWCVSRLTAEISDRYGLAFIFWMTCGAFPGRISVLPAIVRKVAH